jgi:alkylation response protein AidB-like acyl-CoA dehydrogenase
MFSYRPPLRDIAFVLHEWLGISKQKYDVSSYNDLDQETIDSIVESAGDWSAQVLFPLNVVGDREGCTFDAQRQRVVTPKGFKEAYRSYCEGGWASLSCDPAYGGQGLPYVLNQTLYEMLNSANQAWTMYPGLTHGAYACLHAHGSDDQRSRYLSKLTSGEWTGTMCLTEPHCGTDLGMIRTKAVPSDGGYLLSGQKIFISAGEHDFVDNIVHLVLARLPDAPAGSKGISLFVVPKFNIRSDGTLGERNPIYCTGIEHKMGIHGNATCQIQLDNAWGELVGEPHRGLQAMFVMMNAARIGVGVQSLGLTEAAVQQARHYAKERLQMRALQGAVYPDQPADPIVVHPDVRRMLLTGRAYAMGARMLTSYCGVLLDMEHEGIKPDEGIDPSKELALLTPIVKAFITDNAWISTSEALQVFGGHGYIAEWGMEQYVRDARINMIYEGTNGVQALDLLGRKVLSNMGKDLTVLGAKIQETLAQHDVDESLSYAVDALKWGLSTLDACTKHVGFSAMKDKNAVGAASVPYLRLAGHVVYGWLFLQALAICKQSEGEYYRDLEVIIRFYFERLYPETRALKAQIMADPESLMRIPDDRI